MWLFGQRAGLSARKVLGVVTPALLRGRQVSTTKLLNSTYWDLPSQEYDTALKRGHKLLRNKIAKARWTRRKAEEDDEVFIGDWLFASFPWLLLREQRDRLVELAFHERDLTFDEMPDDWHRYSPEEFPGHTVYMIDNEKTIAQRVQVRGSCFLHAPVSDVATLPKDAHPSLKALFI